MLAWLLLSGGEHAHNREVESHMCAAAHVLSRVGALQPALQTADDATTGREPGCHAHSMTAAALAH